MPPMRCVRLAAVLACFLFVGCPPDTPDPKDPKDPKVDGPKDPQPDGPKDPDAPPADEELSQAHLIRPEGLRVFTDGRGQITVPVSGRLSRVFDAEATTGTYNKGVLVATRSGAQVIAPYDGQVVFAGPFRGYGQILIIQHGGGYHTLLAGLRRIDSAVTQWLLAGDNPTTVSANVAPQGSNAAGDTSPIPRGKQQRQAAAEQRRQLRPLQAALAKTESALDQAQSALETLQERLTDNDLYLPENAEPLKALLVQEGELKIEVATLEETWINQQEALEAAGG